MHTPTPWKYGIGEECHDIFDANGAKVCRVYQNVDDRFHIVRAVNAHDALVEALTGCLSLVRGHAWSKHVQEALALARAE